MSAFVTVKESEFAEFRAEASKLGLVLTGRQRPPAMHCGNVVRDLEIVLPDRWQGSMTDAIYDLPGVQSYGFVFGPRGWRRAVHDFFFWRLSRSGT